MSSYLNDDEQVEALKNWWKENGKAVILGISLGIGSVIGWQGWDRYKISQNENASVIFSVMEQQFFRNDKEEGILSAKNILENYSDTVYATFASFYLAKTYRELGKHDIAKTYLILAMEKSNDEALSELAKLRLIRLLIDTQQFESAELYLQNINKIFRGEFFQLMGDLAVKNKKIDLAKKAYSNALSEGVENADLVRMKLANLGKGS